MPADRKASTPSSRHVPITLPATHRPLQVPLSSTSPTSRSRAQPDRPVHGVRQVRELTNEERRRFNSEMYEAIEADDPEAVERLLEDKVAVSYANGLTTPLHAAASKNRAQVARALLVFGMDVNPTNSHGQTPLAVALARGNLDTAHILREFGTFILLIAGGVVSAHTAVQRVSEEEMDSLAGGMSGMSGTWATDELTRLGEAMLDVKMGDEENSRSK